jgi:hypothetical protein
MSLHTQKKKRSEPSKERLVKRLHFLLSTVFHLSQHKKTEAQVHQINLGKDYQEYLIRWPQWWHNEITDASSFISKCVECLIGVFDVTPIMEHCPFTCALRDVKVTEICKLGRQTGREKLFAFVSQKYSIFSTGIGCSKIQGSF